MKVTIHVAQDESALEAKVLKQQIEDLNSHPHVLVDIKYISEYGEFGHPPHR